MTLMNALENGKERKIRIITNNFWLENSNTERKVEIIDCDDYFTLR